MKRIFALIILSAVFFPACATTQWVRTPVVKDRDFVVNLEQREEKGILLTDQYTHPHAIAPADLTRLMADLTYVENAGLMNKKTTFPVFQAEEINRLAPALADALKQADNSQRIRFTSYNRGKGLIFFVSRETEGVVFVESGKKLNLAFSKINSEIEPDATNAFPEDFSRIDPLGIKSASTILNPVSPYGQPGRLDTGKEAPMWIVADLDALKQAVAKAPAIIPPSVSIVPQNPEPSIAAPAPEQTPPTTPALTPQTAVTPDTSAPKNPSDALTQEDIKNKLKYLKELLDEGLISEQDYDAKKSELLEKIQ